MDSLGGRKCAEGEIRNEKEEGGRKLGGGSAPSTPSAKRTSSDSKGALNIGFSMPKLNFFAAAAEAAIGTCAMGTNLDADAAELEDALGAGAATAASALDQLVPARFPQKYCLFL